MKTNKNKSTTTENQTTSDKSLLKKLHLHICVGSGKKGKRWEGLDRPSTIFFS